MTYSDSTTNAYEVYADYESKVLGVIWDKNTDEFVLRLKGLDDGVPCKGHRKRSLLSIISSIYDPLGLISPIVIKLKILFQQVCTEKLDWDDPISASLIDVWKKWLEDAKTVPEIRFTRCYLPDFVIKSNQIHTFFDASKIAFGAVIYLRTQGTERASTNIIASKSRIAPKKKVTIPRLELLAALLAARLWSSIKNTLDTTELDITESYFWGDSKVALCWISNADLDRYKQFVQNRIIEIRKLIRDLPWNHVPGIQNPADLPTRGVSAAALGSMWKHGPSWLSEQPTSWPPLNSRFDDNEESMLEAKVESRRKFLGKENCTATLKIDCSPKVDLGSIIGPEDYSNFQKLKRVTAYVYRFIHNARYPGEPKIGHLDSDEVFNTESLWVKEMQGKLIVDKNFEKLRAQLRIYEDDQGFLRSKGRIDNAEFPLEVSHPIVLPKNHHLVTLIVNEAHQRIFHNGVNQTMSEVRKKFWIPCLRQICRKLIFKCVICKKLEGKPYRPREMPQLPEFRVRASHAFSVSAIDFAGPIYVKKSLGRRSPSVKAYIALISCAYSRALHLELTMDLTAASLIRCLRRFIGRRGSPSLMISDNAATFKSEEVKNFLLDRNIEWRFSTPKSPWQNDIVERMVRSTKRCLKNV